MKVIYIASQYTIGDQGTNVNRQIEIAHKIMDMGHAPIAPNLTHFLHIYRPRPYDDWMNADLAIVKKCDALLRLPGESPGADREVIQAQEFGIPVFFGWNDLKDWLDD